MKKILFIGACDKSELLMYCAKIMSKAAWHVLIVDATMQQRYSYMIPEFEAKQIITECNGFDVATNFLPSCTAGETIYEALNTELQQEQKNLGTYDFVLIDTDISSFLKSDSIRKWGMVDQHVLVSNADRYTISCNIAMLEIYLGKMQTELIPFTEIHYPFVETIVDPEYLRSTLSHLPITFEEEREFLFYLDEREVALKSQMQFESEFRLKSLSRATKRNLLHLLGIWTEVPPKQLQGALKLAERGR
ncbi:hypothetical protein [Paenibacillus massiliensis]|uniref:hypothetical protein n=1 Tax=Paenibacillus massiliensis TaxID=225917 RepID=UPI0003FACBDC|nr:hypothetical protein [Paenibacillus massiliensis]